MDLVAPAKTLGRTTVTSVQSGIMHGAAAQAEGMIARIREEMEGSPKVVATGGLAQLVAPLVRGVDIVDPLVVLEGLRILDALNRSHE